MSQNQTIAAEPEGTAVDRPERTRRGSRLTALIPIATLTLMYIVTVIVAPGYLRAPQIGLLLQLAAILGVVAIGQTLVILIGGIDLSVGAVVTFSNLLAAAAIRGNDSNLPKALFICLSAGAAVGLVNGLVISYLKVPDLVATLASMTAVIGIGLLVTHGAPQGTSSGLLNSFMTRRFLGVVTWGVVLWLVLAIMVVFALRRTIYGRYIYAVGLNREASRYAAVPVRRTVVSLYTLAGTFAGLAGVMLTGYVGSSYLASGDAYQMQSIAAVILGGTSMFGGRGGYGGTVVGVLITVLLVSLLRVIGVAQAGQSIAYGAVILLMLLLFTRRRRA